MSWVAVGSAALQVGSTLLKPKTKTPALAPAVDVNAASKTSLQGNLQNQGDIESLLSQANSFQQDQNTALMEKAMPGYSALAKSLTSTAQGELADPYGVPKDVESNLTRLAAEHGIAAGTKGEFNDFSLLRDFGVNSLQFGQQRIGQAQGITGLLASIAPKVNPLSPLSFYTTPGQAIGAAETNRSAQQASNNVQAGAQNVDQNNTWAGLVKTAGSLWASGSVQGALGGSGTNSV